MPPVRYESYTAVVGFMFYSVRYRTFSTGIFYALCITTIDYLSTTYYSIVACMHLA
jgi:hypothetical protein